MCEKIAQISESDLKKPVLVRRLHGDSRNFYTVTALQWQHALKRDLSIGQTSEAESRMLADFRRIGSLVFAPEDRKLNGVVLPRSLNTISEREEIAEPWLYSLMASPLYPDKYIIRARSSIKYVIGQTRTYVGSAEFDLDKVDKESITEFVPTSEHPFRMLWEIYIDPRQLQVEESPKLQNNMSYSSHKYALEYNVGLRQFVVSYSGSKDYTGISHKFYIA
jgi:hypothetical protein